MSLFLISEITLNGIIFSNLQVSTFHFHYYSYLVFLSSLRIGYQRFSMRQSRYF
jgi:hypothetical protein